MSELDLRIPEKDLCIRPMTDAAYSDWCELNREKSHPIPPDNPEAPDYTIYRHLVWEDRTNASEKPDWIQAGIWHAGDIAGLINLYRKTGEPKAQLGYEIATDYRRRGFASAAVEAMTSYALRELPVAQVEILIAPGNIASRGVALKAGFENTGLINRYLVFNREASALSALRSDLGQSFGLGQSGMELTD